MRLVQLVEIHMLCNIVHVITHLRSGRQQPFGGAPRVPPSMPTPHPRPRPGRREDPGREWKDIGKIKAYGKCMKAVRPPGLTTCSNAAGIAPASDISAAVAARPKVTPATPRMLPVRALFCEARLATTRETWRRWRGKRTRRIATIARRSAVTSASLELRVGAGKLVFDVVSRTWMITYWQKCNKWLLRYQQSPTPNRGSQHSAGTTLPDRQPTRPQGRRNIRRNRRDPPSYGTGLASSR